MQEAKESETGTPHAPEKSFQISPPSITLPKGGGAIRGIGEKFAANPVTGTGSLLVPIATSPGRSGFGPQLSLAYDSGAGNGPFGFGWSLSLPQITRKTDKGLPRYEDTTDSDVFILSGAEDLVPVLVKQGNQWKPETVPPRTVGAKTYAIRRYRPRIEGLFARIERWSNQADPTDVFWRSISKDNITTWYGKDENSRICNPHDKARIFSWLICQSYDDKGNVIVYRYKDEDSDNLDLIQANERNRTVDTRKANRYLKRISYGNRVPYLPLLTETEWPQPPDPNPTGTQRNYYFEVVFDYEDGHYTEAAPDAEGRVFAQPVCYPPASEKWSRRVDPFSSYRSGFEVRTYRLCRRVLMFHHFPAELGTPDCLVRSTDFTYSYENDPNGARNPIYSFLDSVSQSGYLRQGATYLKKSLPPVEFEYTKPTVQDKVEDVDPANLESLPIGVDGTAYQWTDLHGEGIPGILTEQAGAWLYKRNWSPIPDKLSDGNEVVKAKFSTLETVALKPNLVLAGGAQFMDLAGDGQPDLVMLDGPMPGLYEHDEAEGWDPFRPFTSRLNRDMRDPNLKFVDLDGDGHADVLITEQDAFVWHPSLAEEGFGEALRVAQVLDEEKGPRIVFADGTQSIYLADLSGDGLTDLIRIRNGEVCYWPNLGYGKFGAKVTMDNAPWFDNPDQFDHKRIRLADIDGSGTTDIIYLHRDGVRLYFNQSGNSWSKSQQLTVFPRGDDVVSIVPTDLLGNGTACLVWSSPLPGDARRPMRYVNLMGSRKPHLLVKTINNLGAETRVEYAPSTKFYLLDKQADKPWITKLPFPVHVVERVETYDHISCNRFVTRYVYHHGYFDGEEREFRGFGRVDQLDTEEFASLSACDVFPVGDNIDAASHVPPVLTKTWFHTGAYLGREHVSDFFAGLLNATDQGEYFREPGLTDTQARALLLPDTVLPIGLTLEEEREACRALKGSMLRQEVYADNASHPGATPEEIQRARVPYTVTEQNFTIRALQPRESNRHGVFFTHAREAISYHYERNPADPRIQHALTLEVDKYGNVLKQAAIGYGRRASPLSTQWDRDRQTTPLLTYTENSVTNAIESLDAHRNPLPCESITFELTGYTPTGAAGRFQASDLVEPNAAAPSRLRHKFNAPEVAYEATATGNQRRRPIEWLRTLYRRDDLTGLLRLGELQPLALPGESYKLAFTPGLIEQAYQRDGVPLLPAPDQVLPVDAVNGLTANRGGYVDLDGNGRWWLPSDRSYFSDDPANSPQTELGVARGHFFLPRRYRDPFGQDAVVDFDANDLLMVETRDAVGNRVTVDANDYRVLQPRLVSDPNRNRSEVAFDALGMVVATAVMGKAGENLGDLIEGLQGSFNANPTLAHLQAFVADPRSQAAALLGKATTRIVYDLARFARAGQPPFAATLARETHLHDLGGAQTKIQVSFSYSDGFGREIQKKIQAERGEAAQRAPHTTLPSGDWQPGALQRDLNGKPVLGDTPQRWVGNGRTVFNNKGKPVKQYEPFFSATYLYEEERDMTDTGVTPILFYDPVERVVATLHPNHTYEKVVLDPWQQTTYDVNDTCTPRNQQTGDPRTDPDVQGYVREYFNTQPANWETWHVQRIGNAMGADEQNAARRAAAHADTPTIAHFDALGRPFLTVARNRVVCNGHALHGRSDEDFCARVELDIEGNQREVRDERKLLVNYLPDGPIEQRIVMRYAYDMLGNRIRQLSMEAEARWMLNDVAGKPIRAWDGRGHTFRTEYDPLRRPVRTWVTGADPANPNQPLLTERLVYGEQHPQAEVFRLRGKPYLHLDQAGVVTNELYDFEGNLKSNSRRIGKEYKQVIDWSVADAAIPVSAIAQLDLVALEAALAPQLETGTYASQTTYDALNRPLTVTSPDGSIYRPTFNEANLLDQVNVNLRGAMANGQPVWTPFVTNIDYDAKGQRTLIQYGNGAETRYRYDRETFRLINLYTRRSAAFTADCDNPNPPPDTIAAPEKPPAGKRCGLQNLHYTYDPAGNITHIRDDAQQTIYFSGQIIEPSNDYTYDAFYRLIEAKGREHLGQGGAPTPHSYNDSGRVGILSANPPGQFAPNDGNAMDTYTERYVYDAVGNFLQMQHVRSNAAAQGWTRRYAYLDPSLIELAKRSNRLTSTTVGNAPPEAYAHDAHGNMTQMPHLPLMQWDYRDQLQATAQQVVSSGAPETTWYVYDAAGQRVRKVTESMISAQDAANGKQPVRLKERTYLGGFEIYREYENDGVTPKLERETLHIMDDKQRIALVETKTLDVSSPLTPYPSLVRYQFGNHLGSASLELDDQAQIISYEEYAPYGSSTYQAVRNQTETAKRYRYTGKERDEESGFYYHGARYYSAWLGRWASSDPKGLIDGLSLYAYARANPVSLRDKRGFQAEQSETRPTEVDIRKLASEQPTIVSKLLREVALSRSNKEIELPAHEKGNVVKDEKGKEVPYYTPNREIKIEHSGKTSIVGWHCTDYVFNLSYKAGFDPPTSRSKQYWLNTKGVISQAKKLEKEGVIEIVPTPKDNPKTAVDESTQRIRPGDILVWGSQGSYGHHMLITGIDQTRKSAVTTREAGAEVLPEGPKDGREIFLKDAPSMVYRLKKFNEERVEYLYENDAEFRQAFDAAFNKQEEEHRSFNRLKDDLSTRYGPMLPKLTDLSVYKREQPEQPK